VPILRTASVLWLISKDMKKIFTLIIFFFTLLFLSACDSKQPSLSHVLKPDCQYYSLQAAQCLDEQELLKRVEPYQVIFIGDHHSEDNLHKNIASLIASLSQHGFTIHLANEWFYPSDTKVLDAFSRKDINETEFLKQIEWEKRLKFYSYDSFKPMYEAIRDHGGRLYGINLSKVQQKKISDQNLSAMSKEERSFNESLDLEVTPHKKLVMPYLTHCHAPKKNESLQACIKRMYRVQVAWDSKMALESYKLARDLKKDEKLLVFAGAMHIKEHLGIPLRFARLSNLATLTILPTDRQTHEVNNGYGDYLLFYQEKVQEK